jgi:hypothetical protein
MKIKLIIVALLVLNSTIQSVAQTFAGGTGTILDDGSHNYYPLTVSGVIPATIDI